MKNNHFAVIGIGRFGLALTRALLDQGATVVAIDSESKNLEPLKSRLDDVLILDATTKQALLDAGLSDCSVAVVCMGSSIEASVLATISCLEIGIPRVIAKASSEEHKRILEKLGAEVIMPEEEMGKRLAQNLINPLTVDLLNLSEEFTIAEAILSGNFKTSTLGDVNFRNTYGVSVLARISNGKAQSVDARTVLNPDDTIIFSGRKNAVENFISRNTRKE